MTRTERIALLCGYLCAALVVFGALAVAVTSAATGAVCVFVAGMLGVVVATAAIVGAEQHATGGRP